MVTMNCHKDILFLLWLLCQCAFQCVKSQLVGKAGATTTEPHLTDRLAPAGS